MNIKKSLIILPLLAIALGVSASGIVSSFNNKKVEVALAVNPISYISRSWDGLSSSIKNETKQCDDYEVITNIKKNWFSGWYVVNTNVSISERIITSGTVNLILCDGKSLTASKGIHVPLGATLNIYSQSEGTGTLVAAGIDNAAGIGGSSLAVDAGVINIYGGRVTAIGGQYGAGIGGGNKGAGAAVTIYGGRVNATAGLGASGIGNGYTGNVGTNIIYSGTVNATASYPGFAINGTLSVPNSLVVLGNDTQVPSYEDDQQASSSYATNRWPYMVVMHKHNWSYVASGNTITASCSYDDCLETEGLTLTINAGGATYDGDEHKTGTIKSGYNPLVFDSPTISYYKDNVLVDECINAGTYEARVTVGGATAVKQFVIEKAWPIIIQAPQVYDDVHYRYTGSNIYLFEPGSANVEGGTYYFRVGKNGEFSSDYPQAKDVGTYTVYMK
ncbi:MAG: hypothetical protein J5618_01940, partial [Bacilli bacterium]|nr:hypothetical protein [Bacilli bacterium]